MPFPEEVIENIKLGKIYFADLVEDYQNDLNNGGCTCNKGVMYRLDIILTALLYRQEEDNYDLIAENLYNEMLEITGVGGNNYIYTGYYGYGISGSTLTTEQIEAGIPFKYHTGDDVTVPFTIGNFSKVWFAIISTEPIKTSYIEMSNPDNSGSIGSPTDFMSYPTLVSGIRSYNLYISNYATSTNALTFKNGQISKQNIEFGYSNTDPFGSESTKTLQFTKEISTGSSEYSLDFTNTANLKYLIVKEPSTEPLKTIWINTIPYNQGLIPDTKMRVGVIIGSSRYYVSRVPFALSAETSIITLKTI